MRIISGSARGRRLLAPKGMRTRPTPARVREALFSILGTRVTASVVLDLFAGSGALGIEALSRGATRATFVETDARVARIVCRNCEAFDPSTVEVLVMPAARAVDRLRGAGRRFDLAFLDPPYVKNLLAPTLRELTIGPLLNDGAIVVCEHPGREEPPPPPPGLRQWHRRRFGDVALCFYQRDDEAEGDPRP